MNTKTIAILEKFMKPMSDQEVRDFIQKRHPNIGRANAVDDARPAPDQVDDTLPAPTFTPRVD